MSLIPSFKSIKKFIGKHVEHTYTLKVNELDHDKVVNWLGLDESVATALVEYRDQFWIFNELNSEDGRVDLEELWVCVGKPYGGLRQWISEKVRPACARLSSEISDGGNPRHISGVSGSVKACKTVDLDTAKHLAMMVNNEEGDKARRYFIAVEKILRALVKHNMLRVDIHQADEDYRITCINNGDAPEKAEGKMIELRGMTKAILGARNDDQTCPKKYQETHSTVALLRRLGNSHKEVYEALRVPYEDWWDNHKKKEDRS